MLQCHWCHAVLVAITFPLDNNAGKEREGLYCWLVAGLRQNNLARTCVTELDAIPRLIMTKVGFHLT